MGPFVFAIFVVCTSDLLICHNPSFMTTLFADNDTVKCKAYVEEIVAKETNKDYIRMGKCVWRIVTQKEKDSQ